MIVILILKGLFGYNFLYSVGVWTTLFHLLKDNTISSIMLFVITESVLLLIVYSKSELKSEYDEYDSKSSNSNAGSGSGDGWGSGSLD